MATSPDTIAYPDAVTADFKELAAECSACYQCGTCTSSCPSGRELYRGPRRLVRLILAGEVDAVLKSDDLWRCTECGTCTDVCRMEIDVAGVLHRLRRLEREHGGIRCAERSAADVAAQHLRKRPRIDNLRFGAAMVAKGHVPRDKVGAAEMGMKIARQLVPGGKKRPAGEAAAAAGAVTLPFYAGCAIPQDHELHALVRRGGRRVRRPPRRGGGRRLLRPPEPRRRRHAVHRRRHRLHGLPGLRRQPRGGRRLDRPALGRAHRAGARGPAAASRPRRPRFVPYVGCLADRDAALAALGDAAEQAGCTMELAYPTLHNGCCGALGGMYRGATKASGMLLEFAAEQARAHRHLAACSAATTCARPHASSSSTSPSTSGPSSSGPSRPPRRSAPMPDDKTAKDDAVATAKAGKAVEPDETRPISTTRTPSSPRPSFTGPLARPART